MSAMPPTRLLALLCLLTPLSLRAAEPVLGLPCEECELVYVGMPAEPDSRARIAPVEAKGEPMVIVGSVRTRDGAPAPGVIVYGYQTDARGYYPRGANRHGALRGWARTDAQGNYRFDTIRPGAYPLRRDPQHVHLHVVEPGIGTYYIDDLVFDDDPRLTAAQRERVDRGRGGSGIAHPVHDTDGVWQVRRDITLGAGIPGYPDA
jgi:protocatechuate 3,4-dioxygenase beta subunit